MNKFLLFTVGSALLFSVNCFAERQASRFYLKSGVRANLATGIETTLSDDIIGKYENKNFYSIAIGLGYEITSFYNAEVMLTYTPEETLTENYLQEMHEVTSALDVEYTALMINNIFNIADYMKASGFRAKWYFKPYLGVGVGAVLYTVKKYSSTTTSTSEYGSNSDINFTYSAIIGGIYPLSDRLSLDLSYSFVNYGLFESGRNGYENEAYDETATQAPETDWKMHEILLALRYHF